MLAGQVTAFHEQFVQNLTASAGLYASAEAVNAALLQPLPAIAGSVASTIGAFPDQLLNLLNAAVGQLLNLLTSVTNTLASFGDALNTQLATTILYPFLLLFIITFALFGLLGYPVPAFP